MRKRPVICFFCKNHKLGFHRGGKDVTKRVLFIKRVKVYSLFYQIFFLFL